MEQAEQQIAIATAYGWTVIHWGFGELRGRLNGDYERIIPDYLNDLNAMHEAEKTLTHDQLTDYETRLLNVLVRAGGPWRPVSCVTAAERAEAFLRTLNLWKE